MALGITLEYSVSRYVLGRHDGIRFRAEVIEACDMTDAIFAYRMMPKNPETGEYVGAFDHICSPTDIEEYPEAEPIEGQSPQWFRLKYVDVLLRSRSEMDDFKMAIEEDVARLKASLAIQEDLITGDTVTFGASCPEEPDESETSDSESESAEPSVSHGPLLEVTAQSEGYTTVGAGIGWEDTGTGEGTPLSTSNFTSVALKLGQISKGLILQDFDFEELPEGASIQGISGKVWFRSVGASSSESSASLGACDLPPIIAGDQRCPLLFYLGIHQPDLKPTENAAALECLADETFTEFPFGAEDELWDVAWTAADIKRGDFGILAILGTMLACPEVVLDVEGAEITVHYYDA